MLAQIEDDRTIELFRRIRPLRPAVLAHDFTPALQPNQTPSAVSAATTPVLIEVLEGDVAPFFRGRLTQLRHLYEESADSLVSLLLI